MVKKGEKTSHKKRMTIGAQSEKQHQKSQRRKNQVTGRKTGANGFWITKIPLSKLTRIVWGENRSTKDQPTIQENYHRTVRGPQGGSRAKKRAKKKRKKRGTEKLGGKV